MSCYQKEVEIKSMLETARRIDNFPTCMSFPGKDKIDRHLA